MKYTAFESNLDFIILSEWVVLCTKITNVFSKICVNFMDHNDHTSCPIHLYVMIILGLLYTWSDARTHRTHDPSTILIFLMLAFISTKQTSNSRRSSVLKIKNSPMECGIVTHLDKLLRVNYMYGRHCKHSYFI